MMLLIASLLSMAMQGPPWPVLVEDQGGRATYDPASVRSEGSDRVSVRVLTVTVEPTNGASRYETHYLIDCGARTNAFLEARALDAQGAVLRERTTTIDQAELTPIESDSVEEMLHGKVCAGR